MKTTTISIRPCIRAAVSLLFLFGSTHLSMQAQMLRTPFERSEQLLLSPTERQFGEICLLSREKVADPIFPDRGGVKESELRDSAFVCFGSAYGDIRGDYLPYNGNNYSSLSLLSGGRINVRSYGTLRGNASYSRGIHKHIGWNAIRNAEAYYPYLVSDSTGGDYHFEDYRIASNYTFRAGRLPLNIGLTYKGEIAYRLTDPRTTNTTGALELSVATSLSLPKAQTLLLSAAYLYHRQHITLYNWRPGQQDKYFVSYGFGQVDVSNSPIWFGISRMNYLSGWKIGSLLVNQCGGQLGLDYYGYYLNTEEQSSINLFALLYNRLRFYGQKHWSRLSLSFSADYALRQGIERIYEDYQPDDQYHIYDLRILAVRRWYLLNEFAAQLQAAYRILNQGKHLLQVNMGSDFYGSDETYRKHGHHVMNTALRPFAGIVYDHLGAKCDYGLMLSAAYRFVPSQIFRVRTIQKEQLDYQLSFLPHAYRSREGVELRSSGYISMPIQGSHQLKIEVQFYGDLSRRKDGVSYGKEPGVVSHILSDPQAECTEGHSFGGGCNISYLF